MLFFQSALINDQPYAFLFSNIRVNYVCVNFARVKECTAYYSRNKEH